MTLLENCEAEMEKLNVALCGATLVEIGLSGLNPVLVIGG